MYNMEILVFGYKLNLEILILIGVVYLILVGHTICGTCNVPKIMEGLSTMEGLDLMEGLKMKRSKNKNNANTSVASVASVASLSRLAQAEAQAELQAQAQAQAEVQAQAEAEAQAQAQAEAVRAKVAAEDAAFLEALFKITNTPPELRVREEAQLLRVPRDEREAFLKRVAQYFDGKDERDANDARNKAQQAENKARYEAEIRAELQTLSPAEREAKLKQIINEDSHPYGVEIANRLLVSYSKKEGFTGAKTSSLSAQNMTLVQGHTLPEDETLVFFENTKFAPECCPGSYSNSEGCACLTANKFNFLKLRGNNNVPYSEY
jgi:hypothetical protein